MTKKNSNERQQKFSGTKPVQNHLKFDSNKLADWLSKTLNKNINIEEVAEFKGGQSNPTYKVRTSEKTLLHENRLAILPSAHAVDREFRVIDALYSSDFPVPVRLLIAEMTQSLGQNST